MERIFTEENFEKIDGIFELVNQYRINPLLKNEISAKEKRNPGSINNDSELFRRLVRLIAFIAAYGI
jgi:hypothetical protein